MTAAGTFWPQRTVLVTGCSGFLGCWLSQRLSGSGARVIGFCRNPISGTALFSEFGLHERLTVVQGSVRDYALLQQTILDCGVDTIFHLGGQSKVEIAQQHPRETFETNIQGTWNLLEAVRNAGQPIRVVMASTDMVYGDSSELPYTEESSMEAKSPYAASKACAELLGMSYHRTYGVGVCMARTTNLYGGADLGFQRIIPGTIRAVMRGEVPVIQSNGLPERDYLYVEDAVSGYLLLAAAMERPEVCGQTFNFSTEAPVSVLTVVEAILKLMGRSDLKPRVLGHSTNGVAVRHSSSLKARDLLGWVADSSLESGLKKTIAWYRSHANGMHLEARNG